jgi:acyl transferase domain-containing protein/NAD(P)-dependent dehydrogenase (short-subunit alcohol dehydrogenase family)/acyl carrier protein
MSKKDNRYPQEGIAIIGLGCYYPKANGIDQFWNNIVNKVDCITEIPNDRWDPAVYYDPDKNVPDKTYSKIGGFTNPVDFTVLAKKYKIPPKVIAAMDITQKYALLATGDALEDAGYASKEFDRSRTAVIIGNSMGGDKSDYSDFRVFLGGVEHSLKNSPAFSKIDPAMQKKIIEESVYKLKSGILEITEDTMPGELSNVISGRISNALNLTGQSISVDAACASSIASLQEAARGLRCGDFDMAVAGGSDFMMGPSPYVKFSKIGALSPDGSRPFDAGANGFVMGEGSGIFILKRVSDARRDGDKIYAIVAGIGASADGKGKGITAPNPKGQTLAISRSFKEAGYAPNTVQYVEAHGTSTVVGDLAEMEALLSIWDNNGLKNNSIGIGSIKSNIGHLKAAAGSASIIKLALALSKKIMPPSINYKTSNPNIAFGKIPFRVVTDAIAWPEGIDGNPRRGNASAFGFGGTNFHATFEEDTGDNGLPELKKYYTSANFTQKGNAEIMKESQHVNDVNALTTVCDYTHKRYELSEENYKKLEGEAVIIGGSSWNDINEKLAKLKQEISGSRIGLRDLTKRFNIESNTMDYRLGIAAFSIDEFVSKFKSVPEGFDNLKRRMVLKNKGIFFGEHLLEKKKSLGKICFMFPGQGTQYVNMLKDLYNKYKVVKDSFDEADRVMYDIMGKGISEIFFQNDDSSEAELAAAEDLLRPTEITQPGVLTADFAMFRLLRSFGIMPDVVIGHSLGEYGALIASGVISFRDALHAVAARGREIANIKWDDVGKMLSIPAPVEKTEELLKGIQGYAIIANKNCNSQTVVGGESKAVNMVLERCEKEGIPAQEIPVSHAFHTKILDPAGASYRRTLEGFTINSPKIDIVANLNGEYYPKGEKVRSQILDILVKHISNPVEFIKQIERMYADGVNVFIEAGPKRTLSSFVLNILDKRPHLAMATNHPKRGGIGAFNDALAALSTQGFDIDWNGIDELGNKQINPEWRLRNKFLGKSEITVKASAVLEKKIEVKGYDMNNNEQKRYPAQYNTNDLNSVSIDRFYGDFQSCHRKLIEDVLDIYSKKSEELLKDQLNEALYIKREMEKYKINLDKIMISGVAMGLPGERFKVFDDNVYDRLADGINMIDPVPQDVRTKIAEKNITRLLKKSDGEASFEIITDKADVVKLSGRKGRFNLQEEYGVDKEFIDNIEMSTQLAIAAAIEALKDAGIPLVMNYKRTSTNKLLPAFWGLPENMQEDTGIIFGAAFPGENSVIEELSRALAYKYGNKTKKELIKLYSSVIEKVKDEKVREQLSEWYAENYSLLKDGIGEEDIYQFNRKFIFKILVMGHSQLAQFIKAKGPNIHINVACSSTTAGIGIAEDWIRTGRVKRVIVVAADDVTSNEFIEWILSGFLAVGAVSTQEKIEDAAIPFDRRRNGMIVGMGAVGIVVEAESEVRKRGMEPIVEVISTEFGNSAFHGTRLDANHICRVMEKVVSKAEDRLNIKRDEIAKKLLFMSHETYTPARGGSASAEINALRTTFKDNYKDVLVSNTKGFTGHAMAVGIEDVVAVKALQTTKVPPIANHREIDPDLGMINLSKGGKYEHIQYALRLGAGFGSQIAMSVLKLVSRKQDRIIEKGLYARWLKEMSGIENPELEIVKRTLRVKDDGSIMKKDRAAFVESAREEIPVIEDDIAVRTIAVSAVISQPQVSVIAAQSSPGDEIIKQKIMKIVGEKTGYPEDLIEFDLDMESDLGIDTVKQAEMFGMIREAFNIPAEEGIRIKDFPTLNHVVGFVKSKSPMKFTDTAASLIAPQAKPSVQLSQSVSDPAVPTAVMPVGVLDEIRKQIMKIVGEKTGYPEDLIEFDLDMESDLGIDTVKQAEMFGMIREAFNIPAEEGIRIKDFPTLNHVIGFVTSKSPKYAGMGKVVPQAPGRMVAASSLAPQAQLSQPASASAATGVPTGVIDEIRKKIVKIVEEKTGYPEDLIEFDLDMESDLGIDTVKQAEMFGMIRETFSIPADETIRIKDFPTLNHVIGFVTSKSPTFAGMVTNIPKAPASVPSAPSAASATASAFTATQTISAPAAIAGVPGGVLDEIRKKIVKIVEEKTGYPEDLIEFDLDMESDLGIDTVKQAEMFGMIRETFSIPADETIRIKDFPTLNHVIGFVMSKSPKFSDMMTGPASQASAPDTVSAPAPGQSQALPAPAAIDRLPGGVLEEIRKKIVKIVEEKTGYSEDLIEFDLDMESDLGIDTVKQAEMFGMIRETFSIPVDETIRIKDFPTLNHVIGFVTSKSPKFADAVPQTKPGEEKSFAKAEAPKEVKSNIKRMTLEMIEDPIDKKAGPRYDFKGMNVLVTDDGKGVAKAFEKILKESEAKVEIISQTEMESTESLIKAIERAKTAGKINGVIHLTSFEESKSIDEMNFETWRKSIFRRVKSLFFICKTLQKDIIENAKSNSAFIVSVTDMGGTFGIDDFTANNPIGGGVVGLTKGLNKEFLNNTKNVLVKSIDLNASEKPTGIAKTILNEIQFGNKKVEVGYAGKTRMVTQVIYKDIDMDAEPRKLIGEGSVFIVTGGGYGITAAIAKDIAKNFKASLAVISLESLPSNIEELVKLDENGLKQLKEKIIAELKSNNERVTPVMIDKEYAKYTIAIDIYRNIEEMEKLGAPQVEYYSCNVMDHKTMSETIDKIRAKFGHIDAVIHGAGINKDKFLEDKPFVDFSLVVDVKADGCYNIMEAVKKDGIKAFVTFASISGRFGNIGQTDYSAANDLLNKYVEHLNRRFAPDMKAVSMNWSGWLGTGMATRGSIAKIFEESGVDMIPMEEGITKVREELMYGNDAEIIVAGRVGEIDCDKLIVGYKTREFTALNERLKSKDKYPLIDEIVSLKPGKMIVVKKKLNTETDLYLNDHSIDGVPYFPAVMGIETFAETASLLFPDAKIKLMKDIKFNIPVKILKGKAVDMIITAEKVESHGSEIMLKAKLESEFYKDGVKLGNNKLHFEAMVIVSEKGADKKKLKTNGVNMEIIQNAKNGERIINDKEIYKRFFHGPKFQVHAGVINIEGKMIYGELSGKTRKGEDHFSFVKKPNFISNPMAIEAAFQNAGMYAMKKENKMALPDGIEELVFVQIPSNIKDLYMSAKHIKSDELKHEYDTVVLDSQGNVYSVMKGYRMINIGDLKENEKF